MFRPRIFLKIFGSTLVIILLMGLVTTWMATGQVREEVEGETRDRLRSQVELLHELVVLAPDAVAGEAFQSRIHALGRRTGARLTILQADGRVVADSHKDPLGMDNHRDRPEIEASRNAPYGESIRRSDTLSQSMVYIAQAVIVDDQPRLYVRAAQPLVHLEDRLATLRNTVLLSVGVAILIGLLGAFIVARRVAGPLQAMSEVAAAIAQGELATRVPIVTNDEVGDLGRSFNEMAARLEQEVHTIRRDQRELRAILRGMVEGVIAIDTTEHVVLMNEAASQILGIPEGRAAKRPIWETIRVPALLATLSAAVKKATVQTARVRLPIGATDRIVHVYASALTGENGTHRGAVLVLHDVTEREQVESVRRDFIANASHELKTPLASIRGMVETILEDSEMAVETRNDFLHRVVNQTGRLGDLVQEMLSLSRLETDGARVATRAVDARLALRGVLDDAAPSARERTIRVEARLPEAECLVLAEPEALRRIVGNLLDNAIKYSPEGSAVALTAAATDDDLVIEVRDEGPGIAPEKHHRVFERFYRVDGSRSRDLGGTGLGLAIVKHLVQALGGQIQLESMPGEGSTFRVTLPLA